MPRFVFVLILIPLIEIALFIQFGAILGVGGTLFLIVLTAIIGLTAVRRQGLAVLTNIQQAQQSGHSPLGETMHGVLILLAGALLLIPGFLTDAFGFLLLWRGVRNLLLETLLGAFAAHIFARFTNFPPPPKTPSQTDKTPKTSPTNGEIIEGDFRITDAPHNEEK